MTMDGKTSSQADVIDTRPPPAHARAGRVPGEPGLWILVFGEMTLFAAFFAVILLYRGQDPALFARSQQQLSQPLGLLNTMLLLTGSWFVATGMKLARQGCGKPAATCFWLGLLSGVCFGLVKFREYSDKLAIGITLYSNKFFLCYFLFTGVHMAHVAIGMILLALMALQVRRGQFSPGKMVFLEIGATFWHLVDQLWIILYALLYLVK